MPALLFSELEWSPDVVAGLLRTVRPSPGPTSAQTSAFHAASDPATLPGPGSDPRAALRRYRDQILIPLEWPSISKASAASRSGEWRRLSVIASDLGTGYSLQGLAELSRNHGQRLLDRLKPTQRVPVVARFRELVERGAAIPYHPVVFGVVVGMFGVPLTEGMLAYAHQAMRAIVSVGLPAGAQLQPEVADALEESKSTLISELPRALSQGPGIQIC